MTPNLESKNTASITGACLYCGSVEEPQVHRYAADGRVRRLWCTDEAACEARVARLDERYDLTPAGRQALAAIEQAEQLRMVAS